MLRDKDNYYMHIVQMPAWTSKWSTVSKKQRSKLSKPHTIFLIKKKNVWHTTISHYLFSKTNVFLINPKTITFFNCLLYIMPPISLKIWMTLRICRGSWENYRVIYLWQWGWHNKRWFHTSKVLDHDENIMNLK